MKNKIEWPTAAVVIAGIAAVCAMAALKVDATVIAGVASAVIALAGALRQLVAAASIVVVGVLATSVAACTPDARRALLETNLDIAQCAVSNQDLPDAEILKRCAIEAIDAERILRIVGEARTASAKAAERAVSAERAGCGASR